MKKNEKGFSVVEILIIIVVVGIIGGVGWLVYNGRSASKKVADVPTTGAVAKEATKMEAVKPYPYTFKELGISMEVLNGWEVKSNPTQSEGANFYSWTVQKAGADGKIQLSSIGFRGGFNGCEGSNELTAITVKEVASTRNANLMFISWSYVYSNETNYMTSIVPTEETVFRTINDGSAAAIPNKTVKTGNYFFCISEPQAGFSLELNNEAAPGFSRKDSISGLASGSSDTKYLPLPHNAKSYADIKTMLTSIK